MFNEDVYLHALNYNGDLYHYTDEKGYHAIFHPTGLPNDCISLQLTRIDRMVRNDQKERYHIDDAVSKSIQHLSENSIISKTFLDTVASFHHNEMGYFTIATDQVDTSFSSVQHNVLIGHSSVDYYVACFSKNPTNSHIIKTFNAPKRIHFTSSFSLQDTSANGYIGNIHILAPNCCQHFHPFSVLNKCFLNHDIKSVIYNPQEQINIIEDAILEIYDNGNALIENIYNELESMYSSFDAYFKSVNYQNEEEVRLVIRIPHNITPSWLAQNFITFDANREHMYIPIDKFFLAEDML